MSDKSTLSRRELLKAGTVTAAGLALLPSEVLAKLLQITEGERPIAWIDDRNPPEGFKALDWYNLDSWLTPIDQHAPLSHYPVPEVDAATYKLTVTGHVRKTLEFSLDDLKRRPRQEVDFALECSGNGSRADSLPTLVYNAHWTGTPLAPILKESGILDGTVDVVFFGYDQGEELVQPRAGKEIKMKQHFARSLTVEQAMNPDVLIAYEVNGEPLPVGNGFPVRLIIPGWYGIANVKWLKRIEMRSSRFMGRFISRDYVTIREEQHDGMPVWTQMSVGKGRLNSIPARVTRVGDTYKIYGAAWGGGAQRVQVKAGDNSWRPAQIIEGAESEYGWKLWQLEWERPPRGDHDVVSRAISSSGAVQPAPNDPYLQKKRTYWETNAQVTKTFRV